MSLYREGAYNLYNLCDTNIYIDYDDKGQAAGITYNGNTYYYQRNAQNDIVRIYNSAGQSVAEYTYDSWDNVLSITGSEANGVGTVNPFRYRGYFYDTDTGFYYLNSRYYDPAVGQFLNADNHINQKAGIHGTNLFIYCNNDISMEEYLLIHIKGIICLKHKTPFLYSEFKYGGGSPVADISCCECGEEYICIHEEFAPIGTCLNCGEKNHIIFCTY